MATEPFELSREELYAKMWATPASKLATEFGISGVAIAKICRKNQVPKPPLGYWTRIAHGSAPPRTPLPKIPDAKMIKIVPDVGEKQRLSPLGEESELVRKERLQRKGASHTFHNFK